MSIKITPYTIERVAELTESNLAELRSIQERMEQIKNLVSPVLGHLALQKSCRPYTSRILPNIQDIETLYKQALHSFGHVIPTEIQKQTGPDIEFKLESDISWARSTVTKAREKLSKIEVYVDGILEMIKEEKSNPSKWVRDTCPVCGGTGGAKGACYNCGGNGIAWVIR